MKGVGPGRDRHLGSPQSRPSASNSLGPARRVGGSIGQGCTRQLAGGRFLELGTPLREVRVRDRESPPGAGKKALLDTLALGRLVNRQMHDLHVRANKNAERPQGAALVTPPDARATAAIPP